MIIIEIKCRIPGSGKEEIKLISSNVSTTFDWYLKNIKISY